MKKVLSFILAILFALSVAGCTGEGASSSQAETSSQEVSSQAEPSSEESGEPEEPTNVYQDLSFLNEEQQELMRKGDQTYRFFHGRSHELEWDEFRDPTISDAENDEPGSGNFEDRIKWGNGLYEPVSRSLYRNWDDFEKMILEIYTEECFWEMNGMNAVEDVRDINAITDLNNLNRECEEYVTFLNVNGRLYANISTAAGSSELVTEEYELMEQTEDRVFFYRVCFYQRYYPYEAGGKILRCSFPIELLRTPEGWRIQQFTNGRIFEPYLLWREK